MAVLGGEQSPLALKAVYCSLTLQRHCTPSMVTVLIAVLIIEHAGRPFYLLSQSLSKPPYSSLVPSRKLPTENWSGNVGLNSGAFYLQRSYLTVPNQIAAYPITGVAH